LERLVCNFQVLLDLFLVLGLVLLLLLSMLLGSFLWSMFARTFVIVSVFRAFHFFWRSHNVCGQDLWRIQCSLLLRCPVLPWSEGSCSYLGDEGQFQFLLLPLLPFFFGSPSCSCLFSLLWQIDLIVEVYSCHDFFLLFSWLFWFSILLVCKRLDFLLLAFFWYVFSAFLRSLFFSLISGVIHFKFFFGNIFAGLFDVVFHAGLRWFVSFVLRSF
jgi:hypothetical protein